MHSWEMVDLLMVFHFHENFRDDMPISPPHVPLRIVRIVLDLPLEFLADLGDDFVFTVCVEEEVPETFMTMRSKRTTWTQLGVNLGKIVCGAPSSASPSFSWFFLYI